MREGWKKRERERERERDRKSPFVTAVLLWNLPNEGNFHGVPTVIIRERASDSQFLLLSFIFPLHLSGANENN